MKSLSKEEYLKIIQSLQEDSSETDMYDDILDSNWMPAVSPAKERMERAKNRAHSYANIDVTNFKKDKIQEALYNFCNIKISEFLLRIETYHGRPEFNKMYMKSNSPAVSLSMDISLWQEVYRTPSGAPCKMIYTLNLFKDKRFTGRPWLALFDASGKADNVPVETVVEIVRWFQNIKKLSAFM